MPLKRPRHSRTLFQFPLAFASIGLLSLAPVGLHGQEHGAPNQFLTVTESGIFPGKLSIASGGTAVLQITNAPPDATFQWSFENAELPGQTNAHLVLRNIQPHQAGAYHATISTPGQSFRSSATVSVLTTLNDGLVAHWPLDGTAQDTSGKGHHGTLKNVANVSGRFGSAAGALEFNGTSSVIEVPDSSDFAFGAGDLTISYWLKQPSDFKSDGAILGQSAAPQAPDEWIFHPRPFVSFAAESMSGYFLYGAEIATVDAWMHCTLTRQGSSWNFYLDGKLFSTATFERSLPDVPGILTIGAAGGRAYLRGTLDQLRIYRRSLTQDEIEALFLSESPQWLAITMQPVGGSFSAGQTVTLNAAVTGLDPISLQWLRNDQPVAGANSARLNLDRATPLLSGAYALVASNAAGSVTSQVAQVTITWPLSFTKLAPAPFTSPDFGASGCAWADFDNDGLLDFFASSGNGNRYYRNEGNGVLKELFASGATDGAGALVACGDYNNDGFTDLFVAKRWGKNFLYRNNGNHTFTRVLDVAPVEAEGDHVSGAWGDYDNDGWLDLFVATVSGNNQLFRNNKDGSFERVATGPVANDGGVSITAAWGDYNNDSFLDLYVVNDLSQPNFLYRNNRDGTFERILDIAPMQRNWNAAACIWGDYDNNGFLDLFVSDYQAANALFHNNAGETFTDASSAGVNLRSVNGSFSAVWADFNKDGHLDLFAGSATAPHFLHLNRGDGAFVLITNLPPVLEASGAYSVAAADYDNDGDEDLFSTGGNVLFLNNGSSSHWLSLTLRGRISNRSGIGAKVKVTADVDGKTFQQMREISGGNGRSGQNGLRAFFGLGSASIAGNLTIEWPSGIVDAYTNVPVDRLLTAEEGGTRLIVRTLGNGTIERLPDLPSYLVGSEVTVTARPDPLYEFVRWSDGETNPTRKIIVSAGPNTITAIFASTISITRDVLATSEHIFGGTAIDRLMTVRSTAEGGLVLAGSSDSSSSGNKGVSGFGNLDFWIFQLAPTGKKQWESVFGGSSLDELVAAIPTRDGGYLLGGSSRSAPSGNKSSTHFGDTDFWVVKLDRDGNKQWEGNFGGTDKEVLGALAQTLDGGYLLAGTSDSDASGNKSASGGDFEDGWLVKLDSRGNKIWDKAFARGFFEHFAAVAATEDGGCVVAGDSAPGDSYDFWIVKLRSDGSIQWERTFGGNQFDVARLIQPTSDGGYVVAGVSLSSISESKTTDGYGEADFWVLKLDANGGKQWERTFGGSARDEIHALHQTVDGGFLLAGDTSSGISGIKTTPNAGGSDWWLMRIDFNGDLIWQKSFGGPDDDFLNTMQRTLLGCALGGSTGQNLGGSRRVAGFGNRDFWLLQTAFIETPEGTPIVRVNGLYSPVHRHEFLTLNEVEISMTTSFPNGAIYYTTDGTIADFLSPTSTRYTVPFRVAPGSVIQAIAYDGDPEIFYEREQSLETPVQIVFVPSYLLSDITPGGGAALFDPPGGSYPSNSVVTVTAQAAPGWQFLRWEGDATGTEVSTTVRMDQPRSVKAIFGTEIVSRVSGTGGTVSNNPSIGPYPYGSRMWVSALPAAGRFFSRWTITSPTTTNQVLDLPLALTVTNAFQTNSAFFGNIGTGRALTLFVNGAGSIQRTPAQQTAYLPNQEVTLTAVPDPGFTFAGWSGDEISIANPLAIVLTTNKTITAAFGRIPEVRLAEPSHESSHRVTHQLSLVADATDPDGFVKVIHFYSQDPRDNYAPKLIASISNFERLPGGVFRASIKVPQLRKGTYRIVAVAVDELGLESISTPADITVFAEPGDVLAEFVAGEGMSFAPAIGSDGTVYVGAGVYGRSRGKLIALDENLVEKWSLEFGDPNGGIGNSPAIAPDGTIYISSGATLFGFGPDKSPRGEFKTGPHFITAMPAFGADGTIYIGSWDNHFYAFDPRTGETNAMRNLGSIIIHPAAIGADGTIYVHGFDTNKLFALGPDLSIRNEHVLTRAGDFLGGPPVIGRDGTIYMSTGYGLLALSSNLDFKWDGIFANGLAPVLDAEGTIYQTGGSLRAFNPDGSDKSGWAFTAPGYTTSSAAIDAAGNLYVTGDDGLIYGIKPDGSVLWEFQRETTQLLSSSSFSPNLGRNGVIYVGSNQGKLFALQASAELAPNSPWPMLGKNQKHNGNAHGLPGDMLNSIPLGDLVRSSVAIGVDGKKYIGAGNSLFVFSADDAVTSFDLKRNVQSSPVLGPDGTIHVAGDYGTPEGRLMAFDSTGTELWHLDLESAVGRASPALGSDGTVWITSGGKLYSTNAAMNIGRVLDLREALELASLSTQSSPVIGPNGMVYVAAANLLVAIRPDQTIEWTFEATHDPGDGNLFLLVSPAIGADGTIYVVTLHGWLYAIAPQGTERWRTKVDYLCYSSPIIGPDDTVYLTSSHEQFELHAFHGLDGKSKWSQPFTLPAAYSYSVPALGLDGTVYFAAGKSLYAVSDAGDHAEFRWEFRTRDDILSSPVLTAEGEVWVGSDDGNLYVIRAASGPAE
ncbi:MAG: FG-GAP-like repeat-containing protein, partial [Verrucomicrobiota bacterium]